MTPDTIREKIEKILNEHRSDQLLKYQLGSPTGIVRVTQIGYSEQLVTELRALFPKPSRQDLRRILWPYPLSNQLGISFSTIEEAEAWWKCWMDRILAWATGEMQDQVWCPTSCRLPWKWDGTDWVRPINYLTKRPLQAPVVHYCDQCGTPRPADWHAP